ncbi:hypothetical protein GCM10008905_17830 [Clostridium malenominatum]|uniref:Uncharacterized protein n=1 Tax=Clostridium malenominatum TaxID=1539 RepID=A0ABN1IZC2_9CLOT
MRDKLIVSEEIILKIQSRANAIKVLANDKQVLKEAEELLDIIEEILEDNTMTLVEKIEQKMRETKFTDPEMNASLYILHRKLSDGKISPQDAMALFEMYVSSESFDKRII